MELRSCVRLVICLGLLIWAGCGAQTKTVRPDMQVPGHRLVAQELVSLLRAAGRDPASCKLFFMETEEWNAASAGECTFGFTTGLANTGDTTLIRGIAAHEVGHEVLGHADQRKAAIAAEQVIRTGVSLIPGIGGLIASGAVLVAGMIALPAYSRSQEAEADEKAVEFLRVQGDTNPSGTMVYVFRSLLNRYGEKGGGLLDSHPNTKERLEAVQRPRDPRDGPVVAQASPTPARPSLAPAAQALVGQGPAATSAASRPLTSSLERPSYAVGQTWIRNDGEYRLARLGNNLYVFLADKGREVHLTKDLVLVRAKAGAYETSFDPPMELKWPLRVGTWGQGETTWQVPLDPMRLRVKYQWAVEAHEDVHVPAGKFKAFRIVFQWDPAVTDVVTMSNFPRKRLITWYAPEIQELVKAEYSDPGPLNFHILAATVLPTPPLSPSVPAAQPSPPKAPGSSQSAEGKWQEVEERLGKLKELREKNLISEEQYQATMKELMKKLTD